MRYPKAPPSEWNTVFRLEIAKPLILIGAPVGLEPKTN